MRQNSREKARKAILILEDGTVFQGKGFGAVGRITGEVVFNTGMVGYTQSITDPSYRGQILCQTYPLIGNYGVSEKDFESKGPQLRGYIASEVCRRPSHYTSQYSVDNWLEREGIPGIEGIDTRRLTKKLRVQGVMPGILETFDGDEVDVEEKVEELKKEAEKIPDPNQKDLVERVTCDSIEIYGDGGRGPRIGLIDCGAKESIIQYLRKGGAEVIRFPARVEAEEITDRNIDGVLLSNGPGDPKKVPYVVKTVKRLIEYKIPQFGICLGTQLMALALGMDTYKLKFGHRGQNHPVIDQETGRCYITSQNHGYAVKRDGVSKDKDVRVSFLHGNDGSVEGIESKRLRLYGYQWHPEHNPGPEDTQFLFTRFLKEVKKTRREKYV